MPKEIVQHASDVTETAVAVHWSKEASHVQLSITRYPFHGPLDPNYSDDGGELAAEASNQQPVVSGDPDLRSRTEYSDPLTRYQINSLIRTLRRARDGAYGADA